ncbi:MAG: O-antigen ligase family protein [Clostridiales bacterium]|nr:O-antigen ligase family protein [Clostridiales bacterium]
MIKSNRLINILIALVVSFVPMIVLYKSVKLDQFSSLIYGQAAGKGDLFSWYKGQVFIATSAILLIVYLFMLWGGKKYKFKIDYKFIFLGLFSIFMAISYYFSPLKEIALIGIYGRYEGYYIWIAYILIFWIVSNIDFKERDIRFIIYTLMISSTIISIIGLMQFYGKDVFVTEAFNKFANLFVKNKVVLNNSSTMAYGTLYNSNYVGSYAVLVISMILSSLTNEKRRIVKGLMVATIIINFFFLLASQSRAGYLGLAVFAALGVFFFIKNIYKNKWIVLMGAGILVVGFLGYNQLYNENYINEFKSLLEINTLFENSVPPVLNDLNIENNEIAVTTLDDSKVVFDFSDINNVIISENGKEMTYTMEDNVINIDGFERDWKMIYNQTSKKFNLSVKKRGMEFLIMDKGIFVKGIRGEYYKLDDVDDKSYISDKFASNRGYLWNRSIDIVVSRPIVGIGADIYVFRFPQNDILGRINNRISMTLISDKPHSLYLQMAINFGIPFLIAFLFLIGISIYKGFREGLDAKKILALGLVGYLVAGVFNDSIVAVSPVFWVMLGLLNSKFTLEKKHS